MKYNGREIEKGEKIVIMGDEDKEVVSTYIRDEKIELVTPVFKYDGEEIRGFQCWWIPLKEAEEAKKEVEEGNYDTRNKKFASRRTELWTKNM